MLCTGARTEMRLKTNHIIFRPEHPDIHYDKKIASEFEAISIFSEYVFLRGKNFLQEVNSPHV